MNGHDYVIVGGGSAGCVLAARLSEDPDASVLLLEAGGDERRPDVEVPDRWTQLLGSEADWAYRTVVQAQTGHSYPVPRGKVLGGSGSINCMTYLRGHRHDFDGWARSGCVGWDYASVLPYFKRAEHVPGGDPRYRGIGGPLHPTRGEPSVLGDAFISGAQAAGHQLSEDLNCAEMVGTGYVDCLIFGGRRESTATSYLRPAAGRPNLTIVTGATVDRLLIRDGRCRGVRYRRDGAVIEVEAAETVLSAGAIGSPCLLMRSGVGPPDRLSALGIDPIHGAPDVGENLQDHILLSGVRYEAGRVSGGFDGIRGSTLMAVLDDDVHGADLHISAMDGDWSWPWQTPVEHGFTFGIGQMRPQSRGTVRLASADPDTPPIIDPCYLTDPADLVQLIAGIEVVERIVGTGAFDAWAGRSQTTAMLQLDRAALERAVRDAVASNDHATCTCRMGSDAQAVVDPQLRVNGVMGLRVADASVMPVIVSANTNAATIMIAEKASDLIRGRDLPPDPAALALRGSPSP